VSALFCALPDESADRRSTGEVQQTPVQKKSAAPIRYSADRILRRIEENPENSTGIWNEIYATSENGLPAPIFSEAIGLLHDLQRFDAVVEGLLAAIRHDQGAPWMYDVLPHEMKLAQRSEREIARVVASRVDFAVSDVPQLMIAVAMASRFEAWDEANQLAESAAELDPLQRDVWLLGRSVADKSGDWRHRVRTRCGILRHVWSGDYEAQHTEAKTVLADIAERLRRDGQAAAADEVTAKASDSVAVDLQIFLKWVGNADLDLSVKLPDGETCNYKNRLTRGSGWLVREEGGLQTDNRGTGQKCVEHFVCQTAQSGRYEVAVRFLLGEVAAGTAVLEVVRHAGTPVESRESKTVRLSREDAQFVVELAGGRANAKQP
jgi:hypothetical protein